MVPSNNQGFYAGFWSFVLRETPFSAIQMPVYEIMKRYTLRTGKKTESEITALESSRNGAISGIVGTFKLT
jgi:hypothetical protein